MPADRADLARQRQLMRAKQATPTKLKLKTIKQTKSDAAAAASSSETRLPEQVTAAKPVMRSSKTTVAKTTRAAPTINMNMTLLVRQILQHIHYGDAAEYLASTKKEELFRLLGQIAQYAYELREKSQEKVVQLKEETQRAEERWHQFAGRVRELEATAETQAKEREELEQRQALAKDEYTAIVDTLRKYEREWDDAQTTISQQQQLLQEMSRSLQERSGQVDSLTNEVEFVQTRMKELAQQESDHLSQLQVLERESERMQQQLAEERRENKALAWELQTKSRDHNDVMSQLEDAKEGIVTLEGQLQMELIGRKALVQERDNAMLLHHRERDAWKAAQDARAESDLRKAQEYRSMDLENRQLKQALSRARTELDSERIQREKAESAALKATDIADELKAAGKGFHINVQQLAGELREERSVREAKETALATAYRDMQALHKRVREEESARLDAQTEVEALSHRMTLIRRDHLAMLHRVETPPQAVNRWKERTAEGG